MIQYALLFALGFLAATLAGLLIAPAIQRRIVVFTENRMKATMPLSPQEVRAQKDMARAAYAAETAKLSQDIRKERQKLTDERVRNEKLIAQAGAIATENAELHSHIADMEVEANDLRSAIRRVELTVDQLKTALAAADRESRSNAAETTRLARQAEHLIADMDNMRIDLSGRDMSMESLKARVTTLRDERDRLREEMKSASRQVTALELRLSREKTRAGELEDRLAREVAGSADKDETIERRASEITRLRERMNELTMEQAPDANHVLSLPTPALVDVNALEEEVRNQGAALCERLLAATGPDKDALLRREMSDLAARMIVLTAAREGPASPIPDLVADSEPSGDPDGLAAEVRRRLPRSDP